jgi:lysophospholipase L1-like esterase
VRVEPSQPFPSRRMSRRKLTTLTAVLLAAAGLGPATAAASAQPAGSGASAAEPGWVAGWAASPVIGSAVPGSSCPAGAGLTDSTVRNVVFVSAGGSAVRVRLTNAFGARSVVVGHASVAAQAANASPVAGSLRALTFGGSPQVRIAAGGEALSDPVGLRVAALSTLLVSVYVPGPTGPITNHPFTAQGNFLGTGDQVLAGTGAGFADTPCWMLVDGVDVHASGRVVGSVVALGDSITDTANTTGNANRRWPDDLARRLAARRGTTLSVVNAGLGGNRLLEPRDGEPFYGVPALARLDRDVFAQTGVRTVILLEGVNDIGFNAPAADIIAGYQQVIALTHARGLRIMGGTITPFGGSFLGDPGRIATRNAVNAWIRTSHAFDGVIDFARAAASPTDAEALDPRYDSGDHLHPNDAGCQAMADAVNLAALFG